MDKFVDVRLSAEEAELIDFALDLVVDAYGKNLEEGGIVDQLKEKYRGTEARAFVDQLRRRCYIATDLDWSSKEWNQHIIPKDASSNQKWTPQKGEENLIILFQHIQAKT